MSLKLRKEIESYVPKTCEEEVDKKQILNYMDIFDDVLTRENKMCHFTSSAFVVSRDKKKVLMEHHNIYNSWCWEGGHADGEDDLLSVAIREVEEETGVKIIDAKDSKIMSLDILPVLRHKKRGQWVSAHVHLNVAYIFYADENQEIRKKDDENSAVAWKDIDEVIDIVSEPHMIPVYKKLINIIKKES